MRRLRRKLTDAEREERRRWRREAMAPFRRNRRLYMWMLEAKEFLSGVYARTARELLERRGQRPTRENFRAAYLEVEEAVRAASTLRVLPGGPS